MVRADVPPKGDFARKVAETFAAEAALLVVGLATGILTARLLGPSGKGEFALVAIAVSLVYAFGQLGISHSVVYYAKRMPPAQLVPSALSLAAVAGAVSTVVGGTLLYFVASDVLELRRSLLVVGVLALPLTFLDGTARALIQGQYQLRRFNLLRLLNPVAFLPLLALAVVADDRVGAAVLAYVAALAVSATVSVGAAVRMAGAHRRDWVPQWSSWSQIIRLGAQTHVGNVLKFFQYRFDVVLIGALLEKRDVGLYVVGLSLAELPLRVPDAVGLVLFPRLAAARAGTSEREVVSTVSRHVLFVTLLASVALFLLAPWFIGGLFGSQFQDAYAPARILLPGGLALALWKVLAQDLIARGRPNAYSFSAFCSLVAMVVGCLVLVPWLGLAGGALASSLAYLTAAVTLFVAYRRLTGARLRDYVVMRRADFALYRDGFQQVRARLGRRAG